MREKKRQKRTLAEKILTVKVILFKGNFVDIYWVIKRQTGREVQQKTSLQQIIHV